MIVVFIEGDKYMYACAIYHFSIILIISTH